MRVYRIQRRSDGKFSTGGSYPRFTTKGKSWQQLGHVKAHLRQATTHNYQDCDLVAFEVTETEVERTPFGKYLWEKIR